MYSGAGKVANPHKTPALTHTPWLLWLGRSSLHRGIHTHRRRTCGKTGGMVSMPLGSLASRAEAGWLSDTHSWLVHNQNLKVGA